MKTPEERIAKLERRMFLLESRITRLEVRAAEIACGWTDTGCNCRRWSGRPLPECETYAQCVAA